MISLALVALSAYTLIQMCKPRCAACAQRAQDEPSVASASKVAVTQLGGRSGPGNAGGRVYRPEGASRAAIGPPKREERKSKRA